MSRDALVVGINNYQYEGFPQLRTPATDAEAIAKQLERYGEFNVRRLPEAIDPSTKTPFVGKKTQVTLAQLQDTLIQLFKPEGNQVPDTAVFFFSGHGLRVTQGVPEGFLATSDIYPPAKFNGLSVRWLRELLQESPIKQQIIWLDCCHSGELLNLREADPGQRGKTRDRCFIAASRDFEKAFEDMGSEYSILTKYLLEGLDPTRCPQRWVTNYSLVEFLSIRLQAEPQRPTFTNFGEPINLTRTWEVQTTKTVAEVSADICPYKGLEYFDCNEEDPKYFFGREDLTDQLIDRLGQDNFLAILGASGSGKSSVLRAGLLHQLRVGCKLSASDLWQVCIFFPGEHPLQNLALAFVEPDLPRLERAEQFGKAEGLIKEGAEGLRRLVLSGESPRTLVVVDQFEELFTLCEDISEREQFLECLLGALERVGERLCLVLAMRADFFSKCVEREYSGLAKQIQDRMIAVPPMSREQLRHAIVKPAQRVGLEVEGELVEKAIADVEGAPGSLPLLQYTLKELWKERTNNQLRLATYIQLGGIGGTLDKRATKVYEELEPLQKEAAKHIFLTLTRLGEGTEDTRRRVAKRDLVTAKHPEALVEGTIQLLAGEKLVVTSELREKGSELGGTAVIDVAHEALIRYWQLLRGWLRENRELLLQQRKIEAAAVEWRDRSHRGDYLLRGKRLREARDFQKQQIEQFPLSEVAQELIKCSVGHKEFDLYKSLIVFLVIPLTGTVIFFQGVRAYNYAKIIDSCRGVESCPGRINALEGLVKAGIEINRFNLDNAYLEKAELRGAYLRRTYLREAYLRVRSLSGTLRLLNAVEHLLNAV